ncbi:MAG: restriction endonuclease [Candidatus Binatus sp.]|uniref:restriction endonuclease n=1 Tax=Candidatus Binatus sp. TaxID=2811406 RepID=UPI003BAEC465
MSTNRKVPTFDEMMWPTLQALKETGGSASNQELLTRVGQLMAIPEEVQNLPLGDGPRTKFENRMEWARTFLHKVGAIRNSERGVWSITAAGQALTETDVKKIVAQVRAMDRKPPNGSEQSTPEQLEEDPPALRWQDELLAILQNMAPDAFERLAQRILRESGFVKVVVKGKSGDGGIDGIGVLRVNLLSFQVFFQCKRYKDSVSAGAIRDFRGAMVGRTDKGLFITTGRFTPDAKREATRDGAPQIELIDGEETCELLKSLKLGVKTEMVEQVSIVPEMFREFESAG